MENTVGQIDGGRKQPDYFAGLLHFVQTRPNKVDNRKGMWLLLAPDLGLLWSLQEDSRNNRPLIAASFLLTIFRLHLFLKG